MTNLAKTARVGMIAAAMLGGTAAGAAAQYATPTPQPFPSFFPPPQSNPQRGFYIGGGAGANFQENNRFRGGSADSNASYNTGWLALLSFGYGFGNGLRFEIEPGYRSNALDRSGGVAGSGGSDIQSLMVNGLYDFNAPYLWGFEPHVGVGVGAARVHESSSPHGGLLVHGQDIVPAFQAIAGVDYPVTPQLKLGIDYRYFLAHDVNLRADDTGAPVKAGDYNDHAILVTFRYSFGAPPPPPPLAPPPPAPAAAPAVPPAPVARNYTVYFDFNRASLTPAAADVVTAAANTAKQGQATHINVIGHADTVGSARYNQRLSERRAAAVRAALIAKGVSPDQITTEGRGFNDLAVPTAAGVAEPRNRRVVIVVQRPGM